VSSTVAHISQSVLARALTTPLGGVGVSAVGDWSKSKHEDLAGIIWTICVLEPGAACPMDGGCGHQQGKSMCGRVRQSRLFCSAKWRGDCRRELKRSERGCWGAEWATNGRWNSRSMGGGCQLGRLVCVLQGYRGGDLRSRRRNCYKPSAWVHRSLSQNLGFVRGVLVSFGRSLGPSLWSSPRPEGTAGMGGQGAGGVGDGELVLRTNAVVGGRAENEPSWSSLTALASSQQRCTVKLSKLCQPTKGRTALTLGSQSLLERNPENFRTNLLVADEEVCLIAAR